MKQVKRSVAVAFVVGAWVLTGVGAGAKAPQFRDTITVQGGFGGSAEEHHLTFSAPVALPNVALAPGTYIVQARVTAMAVGPMRAHGDCATQPVAAPSPSSARRVHSANSSRSRVATAPPASVTLPAASGS